MIKANDLRLGNALHYQSSDGSISVCILDLDGLKFAIESPSKFNMHYSPINLTEEILILLGFSNEDYNAGYMGIDFKSGNMILDFVLCKPKSKGDWNDCFTYDLEFHRFVSVEYVHELQNLYYVITGNELPLQKLNQ